jgi:DNA polymerase III sliding clamp (beta) subunit (PCNA family)
MEFYIETGALQRAVKDLGVTAKLNTNDYTGLISIEAKEDGELRFVSNNAQNSLLYTLNENVIIKTPGVFVVEYGKIKNFVMSFPIWSEGTGVKDFRFVVKDGKLTVLVSNITPNKKVSTGRLKLLGYDQYAVRQPMPYEKTVFSLNSDVILEAVNKVMYAIDSSDARPFIQGMYLAFDAKSIYFVGTNGKLISEYTFKNESGLTEGGFLLKCEFVQSLRRLVGDNQRVDFEIDERSVKAKFGNVILFGKPIIGHQFPDYKTPLENYKYKLILDKDNLDITSVLDSLNAEDNFRLTLEIKDGTLTLYNDFANLCYENIDYKDNFVVDVNGTYLRSTIDVIRDQKIVMKFTNEQTPVIFDSANYENQKGLITPLRRR